MKTVLAALLAALSLVAAESPVTYKVIPFAIPQQTISGPTTLDGSIITVCSSTKEVSTFRIIPIGTVGGFGGVQLSIFEVQAQKINSIIDTSCASVVAAIAPAFIQSVEVYESVYSEKMKNPYPSHFIDGYTGVLHDVEPVS